MIVEPFPLSEPIRLAGIHINRESFAQVHAAIIHRAGRSGPMDMVVTPNAAHIVQLQKDARLRAIYARAFLTVPDGVPLLWAARWLGRPLSGRVNGTDLFERLCETAASAGYRVFFLGGRTGAADAAAQSLLARYPGLQICGTYCPPLGFERDPIETQRIVARINDARPNVLFVGLGAPKQEYWMDTYRDELDVRVALGIGNSFEFVGGIVARAPRWMQVTGLEWFFRLLSEPQRMWKRYLIGNVQFCSIIAREWIHNRTG
jgi:N-acetylglucosaminyldiphosphoundecaprenol N-acetyl-beta-D-mannosaminyltransferase